jgi:REP element-mobilizing transposase RayT
MSSPIRRFVPGTIYHVTSRTFDELFLLAPDPETVQIFGASLAKFAKAHCIQVFSACCMSDHPHLDVCDPNSALNHFMRDFLSQVARLVNKRLGRRGKFFAQRYTATPVLDDKALLEKVQYTLCNPCNANLVDRATDWQGFTTANQMLSGKPQSYGMINWTKYHQARHRGEKVRPDDFVERYELELHPLPCWAHLPVAEQRRRLKALIEAGEQKARSRRRAEHKAVMPRRALRKIRPTDRSRNPKRGRRPLCHTTDPQAFFAYREEYYSFVAVYRQASGRYRSGHPLTRFPPYAIRPPLLDIT